MDRQDSVFFTGDDVRTLWIALSLMLDDWEGEYAGEGPRGSMAWHVRNAQRLYEKIVVFLEERKNGD